MGNSLRKQGRGADSGAQQPESANVVSSGSARAFLEGIGLGIYVGAFEVAGFDSEDRFQGLTHWDLDTIERQSHVPILPNHRDKILEASRNYVLMAPPAVNEADEVGPTAATSADVTRNVSPEQIDSPTPGWLHSSKAANNDQPVSKTSSATSLAGLSLKNLFCRDAAKRVTGLQQQEMQPGPAEFPTLQPDSPEPLSIAHPDAEPSSSAAATAIADNKSVQADPAVSGSVLSRWLSLRRTSVHAAKQEPDPVLEELPSPAAVEHRPQTPQSPLFAALEKHAGPDATMPAAQMPPPREAETGVPGTQQQSVVQEEATVLLVRVPVHRRTSSPAAGEAAAAAVGAPEAAAPEAAAPEAAAPEAAEAEAATVAPEAAAPQVLAAAPEDSAQGFTLGGFRLSRQAKRKTASKQRPTVVQLFQTTAEVESATKAVPAAASSLHATTEVQDLQVSVPAAQSAVSDTVESETSTAPSEQQEVCIAAAEAPVKAPAPSAQAAAAGGTSGLFKHIRLRPRRAASDKQETSARNQQQQQQVQGVASDEVATEGLPINSTAATNAAAAVIVATTAEEETTAAEEVSSEVAADATAVGAAPGSSTATAPEIEPAAETAVVHELEVQPPALVVESSADLLPTPGPLTLNRTALARSSQGAALPFAGQQRSKAPTAWSQLSNEVSNMSYKKYVTVPLEPKPLPPPKFQVHKPDDVWAELPGQADNLSYVAPPGTAPLAAAMESWAGLPAEASRLLLPGQPSPAAQQPQHLQQPQQRDVSRAQEAPLQPRFMTESGYKQQALPLPQHLSTGVAGPVLVGPLQAGASSTWHASAITAGLPASAQQLHEQVMARLRAHGASHTAAAAAAAGGGVWPMIPAGLGVGPNSSPQHIAQLVKELSSPSPSSTTSFAGPLSSHLPAARVPAAAPRPNMSKQQQHSSAVLPAAMPPATAPGAPAPPTAETSESSGRLGNTWGSQLSASCAQEVATPPLSAESSQITGPAHKGSAGVRQVSTAAAGPVSRSGVSRMLADLSSTATAEHIAGAAHGSALSREQSAASVSHSTTVSRSTLGWEDSRSTVGYDAAAHRGLEVTLLGGTVTPSSTAGSVATDVSTSAARSGSGCRASDVRSIVHRAKERAAARQRLPTPLSPPQEQQEEELAAAIAEPAVLTQQAVTSPCSAQDVQQQPPAARSRGSGLLPPVPSDFKSHRSAGSSFAAAAAAAEDGERTVRMLQDYRTISELDRRIKARVSQLSSPRQSMDGVAAHCAAGTPTADNRMGNDMPVDHGSSTGYDGQGHMVASAAWQHQERQGSDTESAAVTAPPAARYTEHSGRLQQQQQQQAKWSHNDLYEQPGSSAACSSPARGLLGIREALDNSFDGGKRRTANNTAMAAPPQMTMAAGFVSSSSVPVNNRTMSGRYDPNRNPFLSPNTSPEPAAAVTTAPASSNIGVEISAKNNQNPFLRESLVLQPLPPAPAAREHEQQQRHGLTGWRAGIASNNSSSAIGQHPGLSRAVFDDIAAAWMSGRSVAAATAPSCNGCSSSTCGAGPDVGFRGPSNYSRASSASCKGSRTRDTIGMNGQCSGTLPGAALAGQSMANAAAAARTVDERIKRIVATGRARSAKAADSHQQQQHADDLTGPAAADQGQAVHGYAPKAWRFAAAADSHRRPRMHLAQ